MIREIRDRLEGHSTRQNKSPAFANAPPLSSPLEAKLGLCLQNVKRSWLFSQIILNLISDRN